MEFDPQNRPFPVLKNDCLIKAALGLETDFVPVWIMRQAGRYLKDYQKIRSKHSFFEVCQTPTLASEATLLPIRLFDLDAAIIFSDILVIPQALGMTVLIDEDGLHFPNPLEQDSSLASKLNLEVDVKEKLHYVYEAITLTRHNLDGKCPLFGFAGAPWTLMSYMVGPQKPDKLKLEARAWMHNYRQEAHHLLQVLSDKTIDYLVEQVKAGAQLLQLFETAAGILAYDEFKEFSYPYIMKICTEVKERIKKIAPGVKVPIFLYAKGAHYAISLLGQSPSSDVIDVLHLDYTIDPKEARELTNQSLQGNLNPIAMHLNQSGEIRSLVEKMIRDFGTQKYIANLGDGIFPAAKVEAVKLFVDSVHEISRELNKSSE